MKILNDIEKFINSELTTKIKSSSIRYNDLKISIDEKDLCEVILFLKTQNEFQKIFFTIFLVKQHLILQY